MKDGDTLLNYQKDIVLHAVASQDLSIIKEVIPHLVNSNMN